MIDNALLFAQIILFGKLTRNAIMFTLNFFILVELIVWLMMVVFQILNKLMIEDQSFVKVVLFSLQQNHFEMIIVSHRLISFLLLYLLIVHVSVFINKAYFISILQKQLHYKFFAVLAIHKISTALDRSFCLFLPKEERKLQSL